MDREKIIKGVECHRKKIQTTNAVSCLECPYSEPNPIREWCMSGLMDDIYAMLKEQEAKCLTKTELDDLNENQFVWIEGRTGYLYCLQIIGICREKTGVSDIQFNAPTSYVEKSTNTYGESYRIWTNKPTKEQSQAVEWNDD